MIIYTGSSSLFTSSGWPLNALNLKEMTRKTTRPRPRIDRKREFSRFRPLGEAKPSTVSSKNRKNCGFRGRNHQKTEKTANSVDGIIKKQKKLRIPWTESSKNGENCEFRGQNHQKTAKTGFHPRMMSEKR